MAPSIEVLRRPVRNCATRFRAGLALAIGVAAIMVPAASAPAQDVAQARPVAPDSLMSHIRYLASDELAGREAGAPGADSAAAYIARKMGSFGLKPEGREGYLQPFEITTTITVDPSSRLSLSTAAGERALVLGEEWFPFAFSAAGDVSGPAFQAGYGLDDAAYEHHPEEPWLAVIRGGAPPDFDPHAAGIDPSARYKATAAREAGAAAALITVSEIERPEEGEPPRPVGIPALQLVETGEVLTLLESEGLRVAVDAKVSPVRERAYNVVGSVSGRDRALSDEHIVIGAHYDHLGMGGPGSLAPETTAVHNGADDNASGTALLLELARHFADHPDDRPARSLLFVAFSAEEMGLLGSEYLVQHPPVPLERITAMINFDMVGRLRDRRLQVFGTESAREFEAILDSLDARTPLALSYRGDGYGPSDQTSFYARQIPVLHLFTGTHSEYHRPEDDWELIDSEGLAQIATFTIDLIHALGDRTEDLEVVERERPAVTGGGGYGPYLGTIPDFGEVEGGGVRLAGVRSGSPAETAGLQAGDVVIGFADREILNLYDYTYALRAQSPGDTVRIAVRRDGREVEVTAVLEQRR